MPRPGLGGQALTSLGAAPGQNPAAAHGRLAGPESMAALAVTEAFLDKFGRDSLGEIKVNYNNYLKALEKV